MKAHNTTSKKIYCLECREPITSREDLYVVLKDGANRAIHRDCYWRLDEMGLINPPIKTTIGSKSKKKHFAISIIYSLLFATLFGGLASSAARLMGSWLLPVFWIIVGILAVAMPFVSIFFMRKGIEEQLWMPFERHLPATCRDCHEEIPANHKNCPACGWKYAQTEARLKHKAAK